LLTGVSSGISFAPGAYYAPTLSNTNGVQINGDGTLLRTVTQQATNSAAATVTATKAQINTYADKNQRILGQEYLTHWFINLVNTAGGVYTAQKIVMSGDSTTSGNNVSASFTVDSMLAAGLNNKGIQGVTITNAGHPAQGTTAWLSTYLATDLAANPDVYILRWGINDAFFGLTPAQTIANIRSGLSTIRASKSADQMSIVLQMPSSTNDNPNGRNRAYYEQLRNGFVQAARDYQAVFVDLYGALIDSDFTTLCMDTPYQVTPGPSTPIIHIHPANCKNTLYNGLLLDALVPSGTSQLASNNVWNQTGNFMTPASTVLPNALIANNLPVYPLGISIYRAVMPGSAWPYNGQVTTIRQADNVLWQMNSPFNTGTTSYAIRTSLNGTSWNAWLDAGSYVTNPFFFSDTMTLTGAHPCFAAIDTTTAGSGWVGQFGLITQISSNRNPCLGGFANTADTAATMQANATVGGTSSYFSFLTSATANTNPVEKLRLAGGLSVGSANVTTDPGDGNILAKSLTAASWINPTTCTSVASPAVCGANVAGIVQIAAAATTLVINSTAITARTGCWFTYNTEGITAPTNVASLISPYVTARTAGTSLTIAIPVAPLTNPVNLQFGCVN
jgi:hypothetical protein